MCLHAYNTWTRAIRAQSIANTSFVLQFHSLVRYLQFVTQKPRHGTKRKWSTVKESIPFISATWMRKSRRENCCFRWCRPTPLFGTRLLKDHDLQCRQTHGFGSWTSFFSSYRNDRYLSYLSILPLKNKETIVFICHGVRRGLRIYVGWSKKNETFTTQTMLAEFVRHSAAVS